MINIPDPAAYYCGRFRRYEGRFRHAEPPDRGHDQVHNCHGRGRLTHIRDGRFTDWTDLELRAEGGSSSTVWKKRQIRGPVPADH
jgi:hypothetical protein